jgi:hypothetical protein
MSLSCAFTTSLTLAASAYDIFGIFGLTAKQPLLSTIRFLVINIGQLSNHHKYY